MMQRATHAAPLTISCNVDFTRQEWYCLLFRAMQGIKSKCTCIVHGEIIVQILLTISLKNQLVTDFLLIRLFFKDHSFHLLF